MTIKTMKLPEITLDWLREKNACIGGYRYCAEVKITDPIALIQRLIDDEYHSWANWLIVKIMDRKQKIAYAVYAAELVLPIFEKKYPDDLRPRKAIEAAKKYLECDSEENRLIAKYAAFPTSDNYAVCYAARTARNAAYYAAATAHSANDAYTYAAVLDAVLDAYYAAYYAARAAAYAADAYCAADYAYFAANAANKSEKETYAKILAYGIEILTEDKQ